MPLLACELHRWVGQRRRRAAALTLSRLLLASWRRGAHEAGLLYVIDASLVARRLAFALAAFGTDEPSTLACLYCLAMLPLLGGGAQLLQPEVLERLLPLTSAPQPAAAALALHALRNATADIRLRDALASDETNAPDALRAAAVALASHPDAADLAYGALANLQQLDVFCDDGSPPRAEKGGPPRRPRRSDLAAPHAPPPPHVPAPPGAAAGGARAIPRLCQQLQPWASAAARRRGALGLADVLAARSLDGAAALALIDACDAVPLLLGVLGVGDDASATNFVAAPPAQPDAAVRDASLLCLALVARLGGAALLEKGAVVGVGAAALLSPETRTRLCGCVLLASLAVWEDYAAAVAKQIVNAAAASSAGIGVKASGGAYTSGLAVLCALADDEGGGEVAAAAAAAAANVLLHGSAIASVWERPSLPYLVRIDAAERERRLGVARGSPEPV